MEKGTGSASVFHDSVRDIALRLRDDPTPIAQAMMAEAIKLADTFREWETDRPSDDLRVATIRNLFDLNRRAMDYLARSGRPNGGS
jgi:hypothetical protein